MTHAVAVDIGGTFTDLVSYDRQSGEVRYTKAPTTYENFVSGILDCFDKSGVSPSTASVVNHGTTLVINSLIQRRGSKAALVTTAGFRDILEIARGNRPDPFDLHYHRDEPLIPRIHRYELTERIGAEGEIVTPLALDELPALATRLRHDGIEAIGIFFMNSYANAMHEEIAAAELTRLLPGVYVSYSTELAREWYEYERASTVAANAFVGQQVSTYLKQLESDLSSRKFDGSLFMMGSNGGLLSVKRSCSQPIALVESGPIGGCIGASAYAEALGLKNVIAFDMGGTTAKCALVENGSFSVSSLYYVGGYTKGFPIRSPVIDIVEVGAGGGSVAWIDVQKRLHVGPRSAGSTPGPVCYGRGGQEPTVTDANLILGRLDPKRFLGGELHLEVAAARQAFAEKICRPLGYENEQGLVDMAEGVLAIAAVTMAGAIRQISIEHGLDPRDFVLLSYGGGGPLHSSTLAHELSIPTIIVPPEPGNFSAIGMLLADARLDLSTTFAGRLTDERLAESDAAFVRLEEEGAASLLRDFDARNVFFERTAEMRYVGQQHTIKVMVANLRSAAMVRNAFDKAYNQRYGHSDSKAAIEVQTLHLSAFARLSRPALESLPRRTEENRPVGSRKVHFGKVGWQDAAVHQRPSLEAGFVGQGPAVIEEYGSTTIVWPGDTFEIGRLGEIRIHCRLA